MRYQVILYELENGLEKLEGNVVSERPGQAWVTMAKVLYGAKRAEVLELPKAIVPTESAQPKAEAEPLPFEPSSKELEAME